MRCLYTCSRSVAARFQQMPINRDGCEKQSISFVRGLSSVCQSRHPNPLPSSHQGSLLSRRDTQRSQNSRKRRQEAVVVHLACHSPDSIGAWRSGVPKASGAGRWMTPISMGPRWGKSVSQIYTSSEKAGHCLHSPSPRNTPEVALISFQRSTDWSLVRVPYHKTLRQVIACPAICTGHAGLRMWLNRDMRAYRDSAA